MEEDTTYDVRVYRTDVYKGTKVTTYRVRWKVGHRLWQEGFRNAALADSFRSSLLRAARKGGHSAPAPAARPHGSETSPPSPGMT